jgi:hypothetical protein
MPQALLRDSLAGSAERCRDEHGERHPVLIDPLHLAPESTDTLIIKALANYFSSQDPVFMNYL